MLDHLVTHEEWETDWSGREERYELIDGIPLMVPPERGDNYDATSMVMIRLVRVLGEAWSYQQGNSIRIAWEPLLTYRIPDLLIQPADAPREPPLDPAHVALVVEALSPSTRADDLGRTRRDYASVHIPNYLIIDREGSPRLTLLTDPVDGDYRQVAGGDSVTVRIARPGHHPLCLRDHPVSLQRQRSFHVD